MANLKFKSYIFISSNKSIFLHTFFYNSFFLFCFIFFKYTKMPNILSTKYYQENKERLRKAS